MERRRIFTIEEEHLEEGHGLEHQFTKSEQPVDQEHIRQYVAAVLRQFADAKSTPHGQATIDRPMLIADALRTERIVADFPTGHFEPADVAQIEQAVRPIRRAVLEELSKHLDHDEFLLVEKKLSVHSDDYPLAVKAAVGGGGRQRVYRDNRHFFNPEMKRHAFDAYQLLADKEPSPYVSKIISVDERTGDMEVEYKEMNTLQRLMLRFDAARGLGLVGRVSGTRRLLRVLRDGLAGAVYLHRHGVVLQDIKPENIGEPADSRRGKEKIHGILFDLDGMVPEGRDLEQRFLTPNFIPPETRKGVKLPISHKEMTYQFGKSLQEIMQSKNFLLPKEDVETLAELAEWMTKDDPKDRFGVDLPQQILSDLLREEVSPEEKIKKAA